MNTITQMPDNARLWVYQANRSFSESEKIVISNHLSSFVGQWAAHGDQLSATFTIEYDQFIVIAVDESVHQASGCSIDASVGVIRNIEQQFSVSLLDRSQVAFLIEGKIEILPFNKVKEAIVSGAIIANTITFNNAVKSAEEWRNNWAIPACTSWLKKYFS